MSTFDWSNPAVVTLLAQCQKKNVTRITAAHIDQAPKLAEIARYWIANYPGTFGYMVDLRNKLNVGLDLNSNQLAGSLNCLLNEAKRRNYDATMNAQLPAFTPKITTLFAIAECVWCHTEQECIRNADRDYVCKDRKACRNRQRNNQPVAPKATTDEYLAAMDAAEQRSGIDRTMPLETHQTAQETPQAPTGPITQVCANGTYTIVLNEQGDYRTLRLIDCPDSFGKPQGTQIAQYLSGSDNETNYTGFAFVTGATYGIWSKYKKSIAAGYNRQHTGILETALKVLLSADKETQIDYGHAYSLEANRCWRCGRKITRPESIKRGLGPDCAAIIGI